MSKRLRQFLAALFVLAATLGAPPPAGAAADGKTYQREDLASDAVRLAETLRKESAAVGARLKGRSPEQLRRDAEAAIGSGDYKGAETWLGAAVAAAPKDYVNWIAFARLGAAADDAQADGRWQLVQRATTAAYAAYQRASGAPDQASALALLADLFVRHQNWRPALEAYRASLERRDSEDIRKTYEDLREKHGFRIVDYKVDNESANPRVCFHFSEPLAGKTDFSPYVAVSGAANAAISSEDQQICVEGLKHGERYAMVLRQGLPSAGGEALLKAADYEIYVRDRSPQAHFSGHAYVLPRQGQLGAPLTTVNTAKVAVDVYRIGDRNLLGAISRDDFLKPISGARAGEIETQDGVKVWSGAMDIASQLNRDVVTDFPLEKAAGGLKPGIYLVTARPWKAPAQPGAAEAENDNELATQWMVISDVGLETLSGEDGLHVVARSLATAEPLAGVELRLIARNNEVLATRTSGADGRVDFDPGLARGVGGSSPGLLVAQLGDDYNFLSLTQAPFDLTDRGVSGRDPPRALDAFLYTERGVYRSGETVFVAALLRDVEGKAKPGLPLTLVVKRPDGVEYKRVTLPDQGLGGRALSLPLLAGAPQGTWSIDAFADPRAPALGHADFLVQDYQAERLDFTLKPGVAIVNRGETIPVSLNAKFLYGAPASGLDVTGAIRLQAIPNSEIPNYPGFVGGIVDDEFTAVETQFPDKLQTDAKGHADLAIALPDGDAPKPLQVKIIVDVAESGGRTVERVVVLPVRAAGAMIGVKTGALDGLSEGDIAKFEAIVVGADGARIARKGVAWSLYKLDNDYQWYQTDGRWSYEPVKSSRRLASGIVDIGATASAEIAAPVSWGKHRLDLKSADGEQTSITFDVGWGGSASADTPDNAVVTLDKSSYAAGEEARLRIAARAAGKATVALIGDKLERFIDIDLKAGDNIVPFTVGADWGPGAYAVAMTHRPLDVQARRMPGRALGLAWFSIDADARKLAIDIDAPERVRPRGAFKLPLKIAGLAPGEEAHVTVAAVDIGILNLTSFKTPDPAEYFFGQRKLALDIRDLYGLLIDGMEGVAGALQVGGDGAGNLEGNLPTQAPLALFSGVMKVGADGTAEADFDLPGFNGAVRVMAVAWSKSRVGAAQKDVIVRDPVVVTATLPRFLDLGDRSRLHVDIDNVEGPAGNYRLDLALAGPLGAEADALSRTVKLAEHQRLSVDMPLRATGVGVASLDLAIHGPGLTSAQHFALGVQSGASDIYTREIAPLAPGATLALADERLASFVPGTGALSVAVSPFGALDAPTLLQALDRYPYGCSEQTVSRALPLLYVNKLAALEHLGIDPDLDKRIGEAIDREMSRQNSSGAFGLWGADADNDDLWLDAYVADFLTRARERNFAVPARGFDDALDHLRNTALNASDPGEGAGEPIAYALYVLARNGRPIIGDLRYLADARLASFKTPMAKAQIGAALAMLGDRARAGKAFAAALDALDAETDNGLSRPDYGSRLRDGAAVLALLAAKIGFGLRPRDAVADAAPLLRSALRRSARFM